MKKLKVGDSAPFFKVQNQEGKIVCLDDFKEKKLVLYFYPKDMTPGCTTQSCDLRDNYQKLKSEGYAIIGVSADSQEKHQKFIQKHDLPFDLLADVDKNMLKDYGVWGPKKFMGKEYDGIHRTTFIIDEKGIIINIIEKVKTKEHSQQILELRK